VLAAAGNLPHSLPWYFGAFIVAAWLALMVTLFVLVRRRLRSRAERRAWERRGRPGGGHVADDRSIGPGSDVEIW
jgi:hypothetical protein